ncbi:hypothetical protein V6N11_057584 [Hibiscus sabdariffa]|uniref:Uncharacterized protein n=1 Tax=Hibiscus sabdariffa TaxID=183260 RepID=A0ABR2NHS9_9ROSI
MGRAQTVVCVKRVKQEEQEEWDESMPLPGDIIQGCAENDGNDDELFTPAKGKSELSSQLGKMKVETIWVKVRRGDAILKLRVRVVADKSSMLQKRYTIRAARDDRHVAVLGDLTLEECLTLQGEYYMEATVSRCMAWFSASVSSGAPLVFVNIQTEQIVPSERTNPTAKETCLGKQQNTATPVELVQGIRLWFLPGVEEVSLELIPEPEETRFGIEIKRTDEVNLTPNLSFCFFFIHLNDHSIPIAFPQGFIYVFSVTKDSAADRAGLQQLLEQADAKKHLLVISRLEGKSVTPSSVDSDGFIHCCDHNEIQDTLISAIEGMDIIQLHIMAWPNQTRPENSQAVAAVSLWPINGHHHSRAA